MGASQPRSVALALAQGRNIDAADVIALLREVYADGIPTRAEAEELITFDRSLAHSTPSWQEFLSTSVADHVLERSAPVGMIDDRKADWLIDAFSHRPRTATDRAFATVLRVLETARESPPKLAAYAIELIGTALIAGEGAAIGLPAQFSRSIDARGVDLLARVLIAAGGAGGKPVSRAEAEALFDLHDAVAGGVNDPAFAELFYRAIAHYLLAASGRSVEPREEALSLSVPSGKSEGMREPAPAPDYAGGDPIDADLSAWLASRIMRDGRATAAEHALLRLFSGESSEAALARRPFYNHAA